MQNKINQLRDIAFDTKLFLQKSVGLGLRFSQYTWEILNTDMRNIPMKSVKLRQDELLLRDQNTKAFLENCLDITQSNQTQD